MDADFGRFWYGAFVHPSMMSLGFPVRFSIDGFASSARHEDIAMCWCWATDSAASGRQKATSPAEGRSVIRRDIRVSVNHREIRVVGCRRMVDA